MYAYSLNEPVDQLDLMKTAEEVLENVGNPDGFYLNIDKEGMLKEMEITKELFKSLGWEGDGTIKILWMPPFLTGGTGDNYGDFAYFVKQWNNGLCFVCSHYPLPIPSKNIFKSIS